jgi:hypothetical protein
MKKIFALGSCVLLLTGSAFSANFSISSGSISNISFFSNPLGNSLFTNNFGLTDPIFQQAIGGDNVVASVYRPNPWQNLSQLSGGGYDPFFDEGFFDYNPYPNDSLGNAPIWISSNADSTAVTTLYAVQFRLPSVSNASLQINYLLDNYLGSANTSWQGGVNDGFFLNGYALTGASSSGFNDPLGSQYNANITPFLVSGLNTLFINVNNTGAWAGLNFHAAIEYTEGINANDVTPYGVPEPSTYVLFGLGAIGMLMVLRRKKAA